MNFFKKFKKKFFNDIVNFIPKRLRIVLSSGIMAFLLLSSTFFDFSFWWLIIFIITAYFVTYISIWEGIEKIEWVMLFMMPIFFTVAFYLFYFLFPVRWLTRIPFIIVYGFALYAMLLTSNIFNVGVEKSIQLYRAAFSINYLFQTLIVFLSMQVLLTFRLSFFGNGLVAFLITFPLTAQLCWTVSPNAQFERDILRHALMIGVILLQIAVIISFVPIKPAIVALLLTACYYSLSGLIYHYLDQRLFRQTINEHIVVLGFVFIVVFLTIQW
jgi:diacylglycerol kinase